MQKAIVNLDSDLKGRLRNTSLSVNKCMFPIYEAVVNSILSIDDRIEKSGDILKEDAYIDVFVRRIPQTSMVVGKKQPVLDVTIEDNGIGFNKDNYRSFLTMDSQYRADRGCKGIGRLIWLKEFESASIESTYRENGKIYERKFRFNENGVEVEESQELPQKSRIMTRVTLNTVRKEFQEELGKKSAKSMARALLEHCLWFFLRKGGAPKIRIIDGEDVECLDELYEYYLSKQESATFEIKGREFQVLHVWSGIQETARKASYCANERVVTEEKITAVAGLYDNQLKHGDDTLYYACYVTSDYFNEHVTANRTAFEIPEEPKKGQQEVFEDTIYFSTIREKLLDAVREYLKPYLRENLNEGRRKVQQFIEQKAPYYRPLLANMSDDEIIISPNSTEKSIELMLHEALVKKEHKLLEEGHDIMIVREGETEEEYRKRASQFFSEATSLKETTLAHYVVNRKIFLEILRRALRRGEDGRYAKEEDIHNIVMPMRVESDDVKFLENNLWIVDERLAFHTYLASDKNIKSMPITDTDSLRRPDVLIENFIYDNPMFIATSDRMPYTSLRIVEFKRPMRDDYSDKVGKDPIKQCIDYVRDIRKGNMQTKDGRPLKGPNDMVAYCYIICDLVDSMTDLCEYYRFWPTYDGLGYIGFHETYKIYFEVISYDQLLNAAEERNSALFEKLGLPHD